MARKGFTLTELLVTILVTGIIMGSVLALMYLFFTHFEFTSSGVSARQRAEMALSVLAGPVLHAGLGMPVDPEEFQNAFEDIYDLQLTEDEYPSAVNTIDNEKLYLVYGEPTGLSFVGPQDPQTDTIELNGEPSEIRVDDDWVVFPTGEMPFQVTGKNTNANTITLESAGSVQDVALLDELHLVRFLEVYVDGEGLHAADPRSGGDEILIEGIQSVYFEYYNDMKVLLVTITGHGEEGRREDLEEITVSWRVKNL